MRMIEVNIGSDTERGRVWMQVDLIMLSLTLAEARQIALELTEHADALAAREALAET